MFMTFKTIAVRLRQKAAFTLVEVMIAVAILGIMFVALYGGMSSGFAVTQLARENLRATQIMLERMEGIRLYNWEQVVYSNMVPTTFVAHYYPLASNGESQGMPFYGRLIVTNAGITDTTYGDRMRLITVQLRWTNANVPRFRTMSTYISRAGVQNYVYYN
jgi:prepilin-type N-terminal cleavage/methylation domain-containing protein